jgi:hypothetical protein
MYIYTRTYIQVRNLQVNFGPRYAQFSVFAIGAGAQRKSVDAQGVPCTEEYLPGQVVVPMDPPSYASVPDRQVCAFRVYCLGFRVVGVGVGVGEGVGVSVSVSVGVGVGVGLGVGIHVYILNPKQELKELLLSFTSTEARDPYAARGITVEKPEPVPHLDMLILVLGLNPGQTLNPEP